MQHTTDESSFPDDGAFQNDVADQGDISPWLRSSPADTPSPDVTVRVIGMMIRALPTSAREGIQRLLHAEMYAPVLAGVPQPFALLNSNVPDKVLFPIVVGGLHHIATELLQTSGNATLTGNIPLDYALAPSVTLDGSSPSDNEGDIFTGIIPLLLASKAMGGKTPSVSSFTSKLPSPLRSKVDASSKSLADKVRGSSPILRKATSPEAKQRNISKKGLLSDPKNAALDVVNKGKSKLPSSTPVTADMLRQPSINKAAFGSSKIFTGDLDVVYKAVQSLPSVVDSSTVKALIDEARSKLGYDTFTAALSRAIHSRTKGVGYDMGDIVSDSSDDNTGNLKEKGTQAALEFVGKLRDKVKDMPGREFAKDIRQGLGFGVGAESASRVAEKLLDGSPKEALEAVTEAGNPQGTIPQDVYDAIKMQGTPNTSAASQPGSGSGENSIAPGTIGTKFAAFKGHSIMLSNLYDLGMNLLNNRDRAFLLMNRSAGSPVPQAAAYSLSGDIIIRDSLPEIAEFILEDRDTIQSTAFHSIPSEMSNREELSMSDAISALDPGNNSDRMAYTTNQAYADAPDGRGIRLPVSPSNMEPSDRAVLVRTSPSGRSRTRTQDVKDWARKQRQLRRTTGDINDDTFEGDSGPGESGARAANALREKPQSPASSSKAKASAKKKPSSSAYSYVKGLVGNRHGDSVITTMRKMMATSDGKPSSFAARYVGKDRTQRGARYPMAPPTSNTAFISRAYELRKTDKNQGDKVLANMTELGLINKETFRTITGIDYDKMTNDIGLPSSWPTDPTPKTYVPSQGEDTEIRPLLQDYLTKGADAAFPERDSSEKVTPNAADGAVGPPGAGPGRVMSDNVVQQPREESAGQTYSPGMEFLAVVPLSGDVPDHFASKMTLVADGKSHPLVLLKTSTGDIELKTIGDIIEEE